MRATLIALAILVAHAGCLTLPLGVGTQEMNLTFTPTYVKQTPSMSTDFKEALFKLKDTCVEEKNTEEFINNMFYYQAPDVSIPLPMAIYQAIGLQELRAAMGFSPYISGKPLQFPTEEELEADAPTLEAYYDLREPNSMISAFDSEYYKDQIPPQHDLTPSIAYFDKIFPEIRAIYKNTFEELTLMQFQGEQGGKMAVNLLLLEYVVIDLAFNIASVSCVGA